jgi:hypothetical protein
MRAAQTTKTEGGRKFGILEFGLIRAIGPLRRRTLSERCLEWGWVPNKVGIADARLKFFAVHDRSPS